MVYEYAYVVYLTAAMQLTNHISTLVQHTHTQTHTRLVHTVPSKMKAQILKLPNLKK